MAGDAATFPTSIDDPELQVTKERLETTLFTFDTTHHALWAEEIARENQILSELVPAPAQANARCNLAVSTLAESIDRLTALLLEEGVPFRLYPPSGEVGGQVDRSTS